jgi:hypothetical protein
VKKWHIRVEICGKTINLRDNKSSSFSFSTRTRCLIEATFNPPNRRKTLTPEYSI